MPKALSSLRLEPDSRLFFPPAAEGQVTKPLKITNTSSGSVAWKVRTNAPNAFLVAPRAGVLAPGSSVDAEVTLLPNSTFSNWQFQVRAAAVDAECESIERGDWANFPESQQEMAQLRALRANTTPAAAPGNGRDLGVADRDSYGARDRSERREHRRPDEGTDYDYAVGDGIDGAPLESRRGYDRGHSEGYSSSAYAHRSYGMPGENGNDGFGMRRRGADRPPWLQEGRACASSEASRRRASKHDEPDLLPVTDDPPEAGKRSPGLEKPPQMGPVTKGVMGFLIAVLVFNLYLRPLLGAIADI